MVLATCAQRKYFTLRDSFAPEDRVKNASESKGEPHASDEFSRLTRPLAV